jgi:HSP20 family molecular chaperone IbpA
MANEIAANASAISKAAERLNLAKEELLTEEVRVHADKDKIRSQNNRDIATVRDRARREMELASKTGEEERNKVQDLNKINVATVKEQHQRRMLELAERTAAEAALIEGKAVKDIHDLNLAKMSKLLESSTRAEDPFYRAQQFNTDIQEEQEAYNVKIKLPPYEARDVSITGFANQLKISFNRGFESDTPISPTQVNTTRSHQSVTETYILPTNINFKNVSRSYAEGTLTIRIAKANPLKFNPFTPSADTTSAPKTS